ncbi:MAG: nucleotide-binding protein [Thermodesulfobacteriota bacterium]
MSDDKNRNDFSDLSDHELMPDSKKVFVVHGRDGRLRDDFFAFLRALDLNPIEWSEALKLTGKATPYIGEALDSAFKNAQAVIVLLSPDDEVRLSPELWKASEEENEKKLKLQARPNVLFEAGMAFGIHPDRTLLIEVGRVKAFSDVAGRHVVRLSNNAVERNGIAERLRTVGCEVKTAGSDWLTTGNFDITREDKSKPAKNSIHKHSDLDAGDILALLGNWWPKSKHTVPEDVKVNFNEVDELLALPPGSTKKYITQVARKKGFKCGASGNVFGIFEYDVSLD